MKKLNLMSRAEMKNVMGGNAPAEELAGETPRCSDDRLCSYYDMEGDYHSGGCHTMGTGQCRCVEYSGGKAVESVPHSGCLY